jgi:hypothetical protein
MTYGQSLPAYISALLTRVDPGEGTRYRC